MNLGLHETLRDRAIIEVTLVPFDDKPSPVHVGGGAELVKTIIRFPVNGKLIPIIPAESIKGVLRSEATRIAKRLTWDGDVDISVKAHTKKDIHKVEEGSFKDKAQAFIMQVFTKTQVAEVQDKAVEIYASVFCPICRLFGSRYLAGKLNITDAIPEGSSRILAYTSAPINRSTKTVEEGRLFTIEYIEPSPDLKFKFTIIADNLSGQKEAVLLAMLLEFLLSSGIRIGGAKSRGYGLLKIDEGTSYVKYVTFKTNGVDPEQKLENIRKLLMKDGHYSRMLLKEYIKLLRGV
ncbi:MAG: RAMP superfamily CRISPR-associated protein [Aigarchaeota archaeon]|nr:RAMP superfamily CRISPR-associated protein [Aigarchaeota archaeon]